MGLTAHLDIKCIMANYCMRWRGIFEGLSQDGGQAYFSYPPPPPTHLSLMTTYRMCLISLNSTFNDLVSLKTEVNEPTESKYKQTNYFCRHLKSHGRKDCIRIRKPLYGSEDLDPYQNVTDPKQCLFLNSSQFSGLLR